MDGENITQHGTRVARVENCGQCGTLGEVLHQPLVEVLKGIVNTLVLEELVWH